MAYKEILFDVADHIATITLDRPENLNAFSAPTRTTRFAASSSRAPGAPSALARISQPVRRRSTPRNAPIGPSAMQVPSAPSTGAMSACETAAGG